MTPTANGRADFELIESWVAAGARVLDLGCGDGSLLARLKRDRGILGYGVDIDDANVLASLPVPFQIPVLLLVSERGTLGEFNIGQSLVARTMRPVLDAIAMEHHTLSRLDEVEFITDRSIRRQITHHALLSFVFGTVIIGLTINVTAGFIR